MKSKITTDDGQAMEVAGDVMRPGMKFTIEGCGTSARGHAVIGGRSVKTGRPMKAAVLTVFKVSNVLTNGPEQLQADANPR